MTNRSYLGKWEWSGRRFQTDGREHAKCLFWKEKWHFQGKETRVTVAQDARAECWHEAGEADRDQRTQINIVKDLHFYPKSNGEPFTWELTWQD